MRKPFLFLVTLLCIGGVSLTYSCKKESQETTNTTHNSPHTLPIDNNISIIGQWTMTERQPDNLGGLHSLWTFNSNGNCSMRWYEHNYSDENDGYEESGTYVLKNDTIYFVATTEAEYRYYIEQLTESSMILQHIEEGSHYIFEKN